MTLFRPTPRQIVHKIISGGQTGADRAALDAAIALGIAHGGWTPLGRWAEDGALDSKYQVEETPSDDPAVRTEWNVRDSDATLILAHGPLTGGSALTRRLARQYGRPCLYVNLWRAPGDEAVAKITEWLNEHRPRILNVAGPRASGDPRLYEAVRALLVSVFGEHDGANSEDMREN
jgi:hypothetical protein